VNTPPAKAGGFELRLTAGLIGPAADGYRYTTPILSFSFLFHKINGLIFKQP